MQRTDPLPSLRASSTKASCLTWACLVARFTGLVRFFAANAHEITSVRLKSGTTAKVTSFPDPPPQPHRFLLPPPSRECDGNPHRGWRVGWKAEGRGLLVTRPALLPYGPWWPLRTGKGRVVSSRRMSHSNSPDGRRRLCGHGGSVVMRLLLMLPLLFSTFPATCEVAASAGGATRAF